MADKILIIDDDPGIRKAMQEFMQLSGFESFQAANAEEAIKLFHNHEFDITVTDILMPGMDGLAFTDWAKKSHDTDVIVMTGYSENHSYEDAIKKGASDFIFKPIRLEELLLRIKRVLRERKLTHERNKMLKKLEKLAITDDLTKLFNSRRFFRDLELESNRAIRYHHALSLLLLDIDYFKNYNDTYGHLEGDKVIAKIGQIIKSHLRTMDTAYRYGGEEFIIILPETQCNMAQSVADRIREAVESFQFNPEGHAPTNITMSIGVTQYQFNEKLTHFIQRADSAMYASKHKGRNQVTTVTFDNFTPVIAME